MKHLAFWRKARGWRQKDLAEKLGVSASTVKRWEEGRTKPHDTNKKELEKLGFFTAPSLPVQETPPILPAKPKEEHPSTYFVQDRANQDELARLHVLDRMTTTGMGGVLPEQPDLTIFPQVLDVGCGAGGWIIELAQTVPTCTHLVGIDISRTYVEEGRMQATRAGVSDRAEFFAMDATRMLEFPNASFDLVNQRSAASWLRTWYWPKILQEYQRVCRPGGIVRITEPAWTVLTNSPALNTLSDLQLTVFHQAGHLFTPTRDGVISQLARLMEQHGLKNVQTRTSTLDYHFGTPEWKWFFSHIRLGFKTAVPFFERWIRVPEDYNETYEQMLVEMQQPGFEATMHFVTAWGINQWS